ncbi:MAG TPA: hypothetical protein VFG67_01655 [Oleiagrimonas sp.]|nr:hypothetical protein [Oleiagrimonas sp.]
MSNVAVGPGRNVEMTWLARCTTWCAACGGYLLFASQVKSPHEWFTAVGVASGMWYWAYTIRRCGHQDFAMSLSHAREWAKATAALGPAIAKTFPVFVKAALLGRSPGHLLDIRFQRGQEENACDGARRASAVLIASLGPDNFVVRAPLEKNCVLMHAILPQNSSRDPRWLNS